MPGSPTPAARGELRPIAVFDCMPVTLLPLLQARPKSKEEKVATKRIKKAVQRCVLLGNSSEAWRASLLSIPSRRAAFHSAPHCPRRLPLMSCREASQRDNAIERYMRQQFNEVDTICQHNPLLHGNSRLSASNPLLD